MHNTSETQELPKTQPTSSDFWREQKAKLGGQLALDQARKSLPRIVVGSYRTKPLGNLAK